MRRLTLLLATLFLGATLHGGNVTRIEPLSWWTGMKTDLQLLVNGEGIGAYDVSVEGKGLKVKAVHRADSPNYLFVDVEVGKKAKPGTYTLVFRNGPEEIRRPYVIAARESGSADRDSYTAADLIYLIVPDRFANGDPSNDVYSGEYFYGGDPVVQVKDWDHPPAEFDVNRFYGGDLQGVMFKAVPSADTIPLRLSIPRSLSRTLRLAEGDVLRSYFIGERVQVRNFTVGSIYEGISDNSGNPVVLASIDDIRRVNAWNEDRASALEISLSDRYRSRRAEKDMAVNIAGYAYGAGNDEDDPVVAIAAVDKYYNIFDWLDLIDFNVLAILLLMILVAGFNMVSGLLILLFRNISTIGTLKSMGMDDKSIAGVFLRVAARVVAKGMLIGNALALLFCLVQHLTHFVHLNPDNYFLSYVPVHVDVLQLLLVNGASFAVIMLIMLLPSMFISRVDPADTVRVK